MEIMDTRRKEYFRERMKGELSQHPVQIREYFNYIHTFLQLLPHVETVW
jgi:hypothetical protein